MLILLEKQQEVRECEARTLPLLAGIHTSSERNMCHDDDDDDVEDQNSSEYFINYVSGFTGETWTRRPRVRCLYGDLLHRINMKENKEK